MSRENILEYFVLSSLFRGSVLGFTFGSVLGFTAENLEALSRFQEVSIFTR
jgi:hypothetical protein